MTKAAEHKEKKAGLRLSVRSLVEFTYFLEDITPSSGMAELQAGTRAHQARQGKQQGQVERAISQLRTCLGEEITLYGRMDAFTQGDIPFVEEMKLGREAGQWAAPVPAHRAQAMVYAAMVAQELDAPQVRFCVCYVNEAGGVLQAFEEQLPRAALEQELDALVERYMLFAIGEKQHRERRDETLAKMAFPFSSYRAGQRELATQVYTAIARRRRLFASLPTGTGKSAAVLFPALKALGQGKTGKLLYLTARTTARQSPLHALEQMLAQGMEARVMTLSAKEKMCAGFHRCHPADCPRAKGHYVRQEGALQEARAEKALWTDAYITALASRHTLCPFELALAMVQLADVVLMDINYAFDPFAHLKKLFQQQRNMTILADEAHHMVERVRESLSGQMDSAVLGGYRARFGKAVGRKHAYYKALSGVITLLRSLEGDAGEETGGEELETQLSALPEGLVEAVHGLCMEAYALFAHPVADGEAMADCRQVSSLCASFLYGAEHLDEDYALLLSKRGRERALEVCCLLPAKEIARVTKRLHGTVFFSATLQPLEATRQMLGGSAEDACFWLPSPFPPENLAVVRRRLATRYRQREDSAQAVAGSIAQATGLRQGKYIAYFPSYAYLRLVLGHLKEMDTPPLWIQRGDMSQEEQQAFLEGFTLDSSPKLGLCVLGSQFSEGIDLPGDQLIGAIIVGVGLPVPSLRLRAIQDCYQHHFGDGYGYAYRIPGMQKVLQAAGRVIRSERDKGLVLLLDERYYWQEYRQLMPMDWQLSDEVIPQRVATWRCAPE